MLEVADRSDSCAGDNDCKRRHFERLSLLAIEMIWDLFSLLAALWWLCSAVVEEDV